MTRRRSGLKMRRYVSAWWIGLVCVVLFVGDRAAAQEVFHCLFTGSIGGKYPIQMMLGKIDNSLSGRYMYVKVGQWLTIDGSMDGTKTVVLRENDDNGKQTGIFTGRFTRGNVLEGTWTKPDGRDPMPFRLEAEPVSPSKAGSQERVGIRLKRIVVPRAQKGSTAQGDTDIQYPVLSGLADKRLLSRLQTAALPQQEFKGSLAAMKKDPWLLYVDYIVNCNRHSILDVSYRMSGSAAYPDSYDEYITLDIKTGKPLRASDLFLASSLPELAARINQAMQAEIQKTIQKVDKEERPDVRRLLSTAVFTAKDMTQFTVSAQGVTFIYTFGFPHVLKAAEPGGEYFFSFAALRPFVRRDGLLYAFL